MSESKRRMVRRSAEEWRAIVSRFECSGQTSKQFCSVEELVPSTFWFWRRKLGRACEWASIGAANGAAAFVEWADGPSAAPVWEAELDLGEGVVLRLRRPSRC